MALRFFKSYVFAVSLICVWVMAFGCSTPVVKPGAFDARVLERTPIPGDFISAAKNGERIITPHIGWMGEVDPTAHLTFARYRPKRNVKQLER